MRLFLLTLEVAIKAQTINHVIELQEGCHILDLIISHDTATVGKICHRVTIMYFGEMVKIGMRNYDRPACPRLYQGYHQLFPSPKCLIRKRREERNH